MHADLKPANVYLIQDPTITAGYQLKLIDMDFSLLADRRAPWHGHQGYIGTDNYRSPEHMTRGGVPGLASDVFTCGLMLYELLAGYHPYWTDDQAEYARRVQAYAAKPPVLAGPMPAPADNAQVSACLHRCLSPDPAARPTAAELRGDPERTRRPALRSGRASRYGSGHRLRRPSAGRCGADPVRPDRDPGTGWPHPADRREDGDRKSPAAAVRGGQRVLGRPSMRPGPFVHAPMGADAGSGHDQRDPGERSGAHGPSPAPDR